MKAEHGAEPAIGAEPGMAGMLSCGGTADAAPMLMLARPPSTYVVCMSSGLGTHWRRWERSWKALLWGSSISSP